MSTPAQTRERAAPAADSCAERVAAIVRPDVHALSPYRVADARGMIKLDAMESPYDLPAPARARMVAAIASAAVNRYPDGNPDVLKRVIARAFGVPAEAQMLLGNGSDELIQMLCLALARPNAVVLAPEPTFVMYRMHALFAHMRYVGVPLGEGFALAREPMLDAIARESPALVFLSYPNNPTGNLFDEAVVREIVERAPGLVVIDEAYSAFASRSMLASACAFPNMIVLRTVSKLGMAGLRLGYAVGSREWISSIDKVRQPYNVNVLTQAAACALLEDPSWIDAQSARVLHERTRLERELAAIAGCRVFQTETNFVLVRVADAARTFAHLENRGVLVKLLDGWHPMLTNMLRITVGAPSENDCLIEALREAALA